jgi:hypothetical protein
MLKDLNADQARFIGILARTARMQRDSLLGNVPEGDLGGVQPGRGEHNPTADLGFAPLSPESSQTKALREAVTSLPAAARRELYALMRIGQGHLAAKKWHRGLSEAEMLGDNAIAAAILDDPDLHDHLAKGLYETRLAS